MVLYQHQKLENSFNIALFFIGGPADIKGFKLFKEVHSDVLYSNTQNMFPKWHVI